MRVRLMGMSCALALILALVFAGSGTAETTCYLYENSKVVEHGDGNGPGCALTGPGCNECITTASRGVKVCYWVDFNDIYCYWGGQYPDNQI